MKKIQMLISFLVFLLFTSNQVIAVCSPKAKDIPMYKKKSTFRSTNNRTRYHC
jgi:hypothetical protein